MPLDSPDDAGTSWPRDSLVESLATATWVYKTK